jgi:hypothetical protein
MIKIVRIRIVYYGTSPRVWLRITDVFRLQLESCRAATVMQNSHGSWGSDMPDSQVNPKVI